MFIRPDRENISEDEIVTCVILTAAIFKLRNFALFLLLFILKAKYISEFLNR